MPELRRRTGLSSTTIWRQRLLGAFPQPIPLTPGTVARDGRRRGPVGWLESDLERWIADRAAAAGVGSDAGPEPA